MNKQEFLLQLRTGLYGFPQDMIEEYLSFYGEMVDDRIEEGFSEEQAVSEIGSVDKIVEQILAETPFVKIVKEKVRPKRRLQAWEIVLLAVGSPIWISLAIAVFAVVLSVYVSIWSVIISLWAAWGSVVGCSVGGAVGGLIFVTVDYTWAGVALFGASVACGGLAIFLFFGCKMATKGILLLTKKMALGIKSCFVKRRDRNE